MKPLEHWKIIRGCAAHRRAGLGCAEDEVANYVPLFMPHDGIVRKFWTNDGGNWVEVTPDYDKAIKIQFAHLSQYVKLGRAKEGDIIAITGNTGSVTTGPHLHTQIKKNGRRIDPGGYDWGKKEQDMDSLKKQITALKDQVKRLLKLKDGLSLKLQKSWNDEATWREKYKKVNSEKEAAERIIGEKESTIQELNKKIAQCTTEPEGKLATILRILLG